MAINTVKYRVKIDFPWSMHRKGDIIRVYENSCMAYIVQDDEETSSAKFDLREFPDIYELIN